MSTDFTKLIQNLKNDIKTVSEHGGYTTEKIIDPSEKSLSDLIHSASPSHCPEWLSHPMAKLFVKRFMLSTQFFLFFVVFLGVLRPKCLYKNERRVRNDQTIIVPTFSYLYLVVYSGILTGLMHLFLYFHQKALRTING